MRYMRPSPGCHMAQLSPNLYMRAQPTFCTRASHDKSPEAREDFMVSAFDPAFQNDALNLVMAVVLGGVIGFERQWRQRLAGLRTNTLVWLGAAIFVVFAGQFSDASPTRVAAQVVTGIGFLGAGVIWKEGLNVRGLNTAAT